VPAQHAFDCAVVRVVPRVEREEFLNAGVILFCRVRRFLSARILLDRTRLAAFAPALDIDDVQHHLDLIPLVCAGDAAAGAIAGLPLAERFYWLVAPRSTVVQTSPVHSGLCEDPSAELEHLFETMVLPPAECSG